MKYRNVTLSTATVIAALDWLIKCCNNFWRPFVNAFFPIGGTKNIFSNLGNRLWTQFSQVATIYQPLKFEDLNYVSSVVGHYFTGWKARNYLWGLSNNLLTTNPVRFYIRTYHFGKFATKYDTLTRRHNSW